MNVFDYRNRVVSDYADYVRSFIAIRDPDIARFVDERLGSGDLWPNPSIGLNPAFAEGAYVDDLVDEGLLHRECARIFRRKSHPADPGQRLRLHRHQVDAIRAARAGANYVLTTGTGSGKSLTYIIPIVDLVLREGAAGVRAIIVYPMNALANSQALELEKFLSHGYPDGRGPVRFARYTGQEGTEERERIVADPPHILLTNYVMLELMLTRVGIDRELVRHAQDLRFLVFDELHTYRGRQGADVALLARRTREACGAARVQIVGTSATMASEGTFVEQRRRVAEVASLLFGVEVRPEHVVGETLRRATEPAPVHDAAFIEALRARLRSTEGPPTGLDAFLADPLSRWIEGEFGVVQDRTDPACRLVRATPHPVRGTDGAAARLARLCGLDEETCARAIEEQLVAGQLRRSEADAPVFAFRLHQFVSRGDTVYATIEPAGRRELLLEKQEFVPGFDRERHLFPLRFCRACGQEYYYVRRGDGVLEGIPELNAEDADEDEQDGYLFLDARDEGVWPEDEGAQLDRFPEDWKEQRASGEVLKASRRPRRPVPMRVRPDGSFAIAGGGAEGLLAWFIPAPFPFCLRCGVFYEPRSRSDFRKLGTLGSEGRSTATTTLSLAAIRRLRLESGVSAGARKLLCFSDNRQDAALQAGHLNDFVEITLVRAALHRAAVVAGAAGLSHDELTQRIDEALVLEPREFARNPEARFGERQETRSALRDVLGYYVYRDLQRGWRLTSPNLEQCGLLRIEYRSLDEICAADDMWRGPDRAEWLASASPATRLRIARVLLDSMRRHLAIRVGYLERDYQERLKQRSAQFLVAPWALDPEERLEIAAICLPRAAAGDSEYGFYLSPRGGFGRFLRRAGTFPEADGRRPALDEVEPIIRSLFAALDGEVVTRVDAYRTGEQGYQLMASAMRWHAGDGARIDFDPVDVPEPPAEPVAPNRYFVELYRNGSFDRPRIIAREHTAQVDKEIRRQREDAFRGGTLPVLYCSPTMELGIDIADLNVVGLRNVPPTPANYAQRSGRAGRSGQAALVFTYCSAGSPHDQYFFRNPAQMVSGQVAPPRIDLANHDLVRAHLHAIWLAEAGVDLGRSLIEVIDLGSLDSLRFVPRIRAALDDAGFRRRARARAAEVIGPVAAALCFESLWGADWLDRAFDSIEDSFRQACERWLSMYRAAWEQREEQHRIAGDHSRSAEEVRTARNLRDQAERYARLLRAEEGDSEQSDFNSYRYFASEGFLPGYSFPRLPLTAFLPSSRGGGRDDVLSRPRFLAISEFGPQNLVYHEGARYRVERVLFPVEDRATSGEARLPTSAAKVCPACGYLHPASEATSADSCVHCNARLEAAITNLLRMQNVITRRTYRITSDEEERRRMGYELRVAVRFDVVNGHLARRTAEVQGAGGRLAMLSYGAAATLWRMNRRWRKRRSPELGFWIDIERGRWTSETRVEEAAGEPDAARPLRVARVVPYVEDRKNSLLFEPVIPHADGEVRRAFAASLVAALKRAIQVEYQLEDNELAAELLPTREEPRAILFYEAAEGGAGVLRQLVDVAAALPRIAARAVTLCHIDPASGVEVAAVRGRPPCELACYDCLMSYTNQPDHARLDRHLVLPALRALAASEVLSSPVAEPRAEHAARLERLSGSDLERRFLAFLDERGHRLPDRANHLIERAGTRPDFLYEAEQVTVYIDGPHHAFPDRAARDRRQEQALYDLGYTVIRFAADDDWPRIIAEHAWLFGPGRSRP